MDPLDRAVQAVYETEPHPGVKALEMAIDELQARKESLVLASKIVADAQGRAVTSDISRDARRHRQVQNALGWLQKMKSDLSSKGTYTLPTEEEGDDREQQ
jgi:DICT domain-containing protein